MDTYMKSLVLMKRVRRVFGMPRHSIATCSDVAHCGETRGVQTTDHKKGMTFDLTDISFSINCSIYPYFLYLLYFDAAMNIYIVI